MSNDKLQALKTLSEAATPGPWTINWVDDQTAELCAEPRIGRAVAYIEGTGEKWGNDPTVQFIAAANPQAVLALIGRFERIRLRVLMAAEGIKAEQVDLSNHQQLIDDLRAIVEN